MNVNYENWTVSGDRNMLETVLSIFLTLLVIRFNQLFILTRSNSHDFELGTGRCLYLFLHA